MASSETPENRRSTPVEAREDDGDSVIESLSEIGGIALGTLADLVPGLGPVLSGGPVVGARVGEVFGEYWEARRYLQTHPDRHETAGKMESGERPGLVFVAVDVHSDEEAREVEQVMQRHGAQPHRDGVVTAADVADVLSAELHSSQDHSAEDHSLM